MARKKKQPDHVAQVEELLESAWGLDPGPAKIAVLEEAVRLADAAGDGLLGYEARSELIEAATFGGAPEVAMVAFAWCLAYHDKNPDQVFDYDLLWKYKWVLDSAPEYPQIGREQIEDMLADMEKRYRAFGSTMHAVHQMARELYRMMGDYKAAKKAHAKVMRCESDLLSNCAACEQNAQAKFYLETGEYALALEKAQPLVTGKMRCAEVPHVTYSHLLLPLARAGELETAAEYHRKGTRLIGANPKLLAPASRHILFLTFTDNLGAALKLFEKHAPNAAVCTCPAWKFDFLRAGAFLFDRLAEQPKPPRVRLPEALELPPDVDRKSPAALRDHFLAEARKLAKAFDARNGNKMYARELEELKELKAQVTPYRV